MFGRRMHYGRWGYGRRFFRGPRWYGRRGCCPGCGCGLLLPLLLFGGLAALFLAHIL
jgi:hypothetical protein